MGCFIYLYNNNVAVVIANNLLINNVFVVINDVLTELVGKSNFNFFNDNYDIVSGTRIVIDSYDYITIDDKLFVPVRLFDLNNSNKSCMLSDSIYFIELDALLNNSWYSESITKIYNDYLNDNKKSISTYRKLSGIDKDFIHIVLEICFILLYILLYVVCLSASIYYVYEYKNILSVLLIFVPGVVYLLLDKLQKVIANLYYNKYLSNNKLNCYKSIMSKNSL